MRHITLIILIAIVIFYIKPYKKHQVTASNSKCLIADTYYLQEYKALGKDPSDRTIDHTKLKCLKYQCDSLKFEKGRWIVIESKVQDKMCFNGVLFF